ncbi:MAG: SCP2 sterol-binding domain-containing protein [Promethearchaeota archaeon]
MITKEIIKQDLSKWIDKFEDPEFDNQFEGYNKVFQFVFTDIDYKLQMVFKNKTARLVKGFKEDADMSLEIISELFHKMVLGEVDPMGAFMEGQIILRGFMNDLEKLEIFLDLLLLFFQKATDQLPKKRLTDCF